MRIMYGRGKRERGFATRNTIVGIASRDKAMKSWVRYLLALVGVLPIIGMATAARADIPSPDVAPTVISVAVYHNLLEPNDTLFRIYAKIPYATVPTLSGNVTCLVNEAFLWRLLDGAGALVGSNAEFPYHFGGYGYNVASLYFDNVTAITWMGTYSLQLIGIPPGFTSTTPSWSFNIPLSAWDISNDQLVNQTDLAGDVISLSGTLDGLWGNNATTSLLFQSEVGAQLSQQGQYFWNGAIPGLQGMAPAAYQIGVGNISTTPTTWSDNYTTALNSQWGSDNSTVWMANAQQGGADFFNLSWDLLTVILVFVIGAALTIGNIALSGDAWNGFIDLGIWLILAARLGMYGLAFLALLEAVCVIYIAAKLWGLR